MSAPEFVIKQQQRKRPPGSHSIVCPWWTGDSWTIYFSFAKRYSADDARALLRHRFHRMDPQPLIRSWHEENRQQRRRTAN